MYYTPSGFFISLQINYLKLTKAFKTHPKTIKTLSKAIKTHQKTIKTHPKTIHNLPKVFHNYPKAFKTHLIVIVFPSEDKDLSKVPILISSTN